MKEMIDLRETTDTREEEIDPREEETDLREVMIEMTDNHHQVDMKEKRRHMIAITLDLMTGHSKKGPRSKP